MRKRLKQATPTYVSCFTVSRGTVVGSNTASASAQVSASLCEAPSACLPVARTARSVLATASSGSSAASRPSSKLYAPKPDACVGGEAP